LRAGAFCFAAALRAGAFLATALRAGAFLAAALRAGAFFAAAFLAGAFFAAAFLGAAFLVAVAIVFSWIDINGEETPPRGCWRRAATIHGNVAQGPHHEHGWQRACGPPDDRRRSRQAADSLWKRAHGARSRKKMASHSACVGRGGRIPAWTAVAA
jgi:hypothetical protein